MFCCFEKKRQAQRKKVEKKRQAQRKKDDNDLELPPLTTAEKLQRLRTLDLFVLDNSVRETTVAQIRGHTNNDKYKILDWVLRQNDVKSDHVKKLNGTSVDGIRDVIVGVFGTRKKVDDYFCEDLRDTERGQAYHAQNHFYAFAELRDNVAPDGIPDHELPIGMERAAEYKLPNLVVELDLLCPLTNWDVFTMDRYCALVQKRIDYIREKCHKKHQKESYNNRIFINIRDFCPAWEKQPDRVKYLVRYLATLEQPITGLCMEDPTGTVLPCVMGDMVRATAQLYKQHGWKDGHLLLHAHQAYGLAEASILEGLMNGATGIWAGIPREGAACGHGNSLTTIANLYRLGNPHVRRKFDLAALRQAAIEMTKIITGQEPHPMTELYGSRAFDICFDPSLGMGGGDDGEDDMTKAFELQPKTRITTMCNASMFAKAMKENFGNEFTFTDDLPNKMMLQMEQDLNESRKEEYNSVVGFASLYERAGGPMTALVKKAVMMDQDADAHPLIEQLHNYCNEWRSCRRASDRMITYIQFYDGFCAKYLPCYTCPIARDAFQILDMDGNGYIDWDEVLFRAKWVLKEFPEECNDIEGMMKMLFEKYIMPEIALGVRTKLAAERQSVKLKAGQLPLPESAKEESAIFAAL